MKKVIAFTILLTLAFTAFSADIIQPRLSIHLGLFTSYTELKQTDTRFGTTGFVSSYPDMVANAEIEVGALIAGWVFVEGEFNTLMSVPSFDSVDKIWFGPFQMEYGIRAGVEHFGFRIGFEHWCYHPVDTFGQSYTKKYGGSNEFFVEYQYGY